MNHDEILLLFQRYLAAELRTKHSGSVVPRATHEGALLDPIRHMQERARDSTFQLRLQRQGLAGASWLDAT
ncbi:MAG TPA: hypothetical protein VGS78_12480 [Candidatus Sulfotelmatobacter sp.]|nr:hypothetical protein [Candidatus Sulfotelmatobacter sp.]